MKNNNPFIFKLEKRMTKAERIESVASVLYDEIQENGEYQNGFLFRFFPTWSADTIMAGEKMCLDYMKKDLENK